MNTTSESMSIQTTAQARPAGEHLRANLAVLLAALGLWLLAFWPSFRDMAALWLRSDTFAHGLVVLPISAYLIWRRRDHWSALAARPAWAMLVPLLAGMLAWAAGVAFSIASLEHLAAVAVLILAVWLAVGHPVFGTIAFPLGFLLFMAPAGDFLVPTLMDYTADFTVAALRATGVPVFQEGHHFVVPNGRWSVVEACSGIRYLIASLMVGMLYAYLNYRSQWRRAVFCLVALVVPILANWLRAYMIVLIGYLSDNELAVGVDHLLYGWVFFGIVIVLMFWIGNRWAEPDEVSAPAPDPALTLAPRRGALPGLVAVAVLLGLAAGVGHAIRPVNSAVQLAVAPLTPLAGWAEADRAKAFEPAFVGQRGQLAQVFVHQGAPVSLFVALYADQAPGHEMVAWSNQLLPDKKTWRQVAGSVVTLAPGRVNQARLIGPEGEFHVWHWYRIGGLVEPDDYRATLRLAWRRLTGGDDQGAHVVLAVRGEDAAAAREQAERFLEAHQGRIDAMIDAARPVPGR
jgi:exosortase A